MQLEQAASELYKETQQKQASFNEQLQQFSQEFNNVLVIPPMAERGSMSYREPITEREPVDPWEPMSHREPIMESQPEPVPEPTWPVFKLF